MIKAADALSTSIGNLVMASRRRKKTTHTLAEQAKRRAIMDQLLSNMEKVGQIMTSIRIK